jgi:hypothetical protein
VLGTRPSDPGTHHKPFLSSGLENVKCGPKWNQSGKNGKGASGLGTPVDLSPERRGAEKGVLIAHLVGTLQPRRGLHGENRVVDQLYDIAPAVHFRAHAETRVAVFLPMDSFSFLYREMFHRSTPRLDNRTTYPTYRTDLGNLEPAEARRSPKTPVLFAGMKM